MRSIEKPGGTRRLWIALRRFVLGRSDWDYLKQFTGSDTYWANAIAAERGWPDTAKRDLDGPHAPGSA
jgi:hypothetical protein